MKEDPGSDTGGHGSPSAETNWSVDIEGRGRHGWVRYREPAGMLSFYWEFGGADVVAGIQVGDEAAWRAHGPWAAGRRTEILRRVADEVIRQMSPKSRAEFDEKSGWINIRGGHTAPATSRADQGAAFVKRLRNLKFMLGLIVLGMAVAWIALRKVTMISSPTGFPVGLSVRTPKHIATLIQALEPYTPSLHRNPANDRYRIALFLYPVDGRSGGRMVQIAKQRPAGEFRLAKLLGSDGHTVWYSVNGLGGVNIATGKLVGLAELRAANPSLDEAWDDPRRVSFEGRLRVDSPDRQTVLEVDPATLKAAPASVQRRVTNLPFEPELEAFLSSGVRPTPNEWLGLLSQTEVERDYRPKSWISTSDRPDKTKEMRRFYRGSLDAESPRGSRQIVSMTAVGGDEYLNAGFVRAGLSMDPLRFADPDGFLMIYTSAPGLKGTTVVARVDNDGKLAWKTDTGIERFKLSQILPDARAVAFIGTRPSELNKVPEPILVMVDTQSGSQHTSTLWK